jgi:hypothetical protein
MPWWFQGYHPAPEDRRLVAQELVMPLFLDTHQHIPGLTAEGVAQAHARDLEFGPKHGVNYVKYWFDEATGRVYCLFEGPDAESGIAVHREAHGLLADEVIPVREGA